MNREKLEAMEPSEVKQVAIDLEVKHHHAAGKPKIIDAIMAKLDGVPVENPETFIAPEDGVIAAVIDEGDNLPEEIEPCEGVTTLTAEEQLATALQRIARMEEEAEVKKEKSKEVGNLPPVPTAQPTATQTFNPDAKVNTGKVKYPTQEEVKAKLAPQIARGLGIASMDDEYWHFKVDLKEAAGNMQMPLGQFVIQANLLLRATSTPTEGDDMNEILDTKKKQGRIGR